MNGRIRNQKVRGPPLLRYRMKYKMKAVVDRCVSDEIDITIEAESEDAAVALAHIVLEVFPLPHTEDGVTSCYVSKRNYQNAELMLLRRDEEEEGAG